MTYANGVHVAEVAADPESGTTGAAAVISAVEDALRPFGVRIGDALIAAAALRALIRSGVERSINGREGDNDTPS